MRDLFASQEPPEGRDGESPKAPHQEKLRPLADQLRPQRLDEVIGQESLLGEGGALRQILTQRILPSIVFWGPPGVGKTTIARLLAKEMAPHDADHPRPQAFVQISAIFSGVAELKKLFEQARQRQEMGQHTVLFVDEIHRFNRAQQDSFLPVMEDGTLTLIGATTENPSFELNPALLSRAQVLVLEALRPRHLEALLARAEAHQGQPLPLLKEARALLIEMADGDGRHVLNMAEQIYGAAPKAPLGRADLLRFITRRAARYDKSGDGHYNLISALHKSVRGSDPDAALYWLARMLKGGEDPRYIARRVLRMAVEDIGLADPQAQRVCLDAWESYERLGSPEGELALSQAVVYLALAPKSNAAYVAHKAALRDATEHGSLMPPKHILNAPTALMKEAGYGADYAYDHDAEDGFSGQNYFPDAMARAQYYAPYERGFERDLGKRIAWFEKLRAKRQAQ